MDEFLEMLVQFAVTLLTAAMTYYGSIALAAVRSYAKSKMSASNVALIERTIDSAAAYVKAQGLDTESAAWVSEMMGYTKRSIPETLDREKVGDVQLINKIKAMKPDIEDRLYKELGKAISGGLRY